MKYSLRILSLSVLAAGPAYAQSTGPITTERLTITGPGSSGDVSGMSVAPSTSAASGTLSRMIADRALAAFGIPADRAVPVRIDLRASATKSIYDYGLARGATDITAALPAIRKATDSPMVSIPEGTFFVSSPAEDDCYFKSNASIIGAGRGRTIIKFVPTNGKWLRAPFAWSGASDVGLRNLTLDTMGIPANSIYGQDYAPAL